MADAYFPWDEGESNPAIFEARSIISAPLERS